MESVKTDQQKVVDASAKVGSRLTEVPGLKGIRVLGKDSWGNWRAESLHNQEYDLMERKRVAAGIVITPKGREFIHHHPHFLRAIEEGRLNPKSVFDKGSSSVVVHPHEYPDVVIKFIRFAPSQTMTEEQKGTARDYSKDPNTPYYLAQAATGIDQLYWKLVTQKVLENHDMSTAKPLLATRDVLVEEYVEGVTLLDFLIMHNKLVSEPRFLQFVQSVTEITDTVRSELLQFLRDEASSGNKTLYQLPTVFDITPPYQWKENLINKGIIIAHSSLSNWIVKGKDMSNIQLDAARISKEEQQSWIKEHLVLVDPFATFTSLTEEEAKQMEVLGIHWNDVSLVSKNNKSETFGTQPDMDSGT